MFPFNCSSLCLVISRACFWELRRVSRYRESCLFGVKRMQVSRCGDKVLLPWSFCDLGIRWEARKVMEVWKCAKQAVKGKGRLKHFCPLTEWGFAALSCLKRYMPDQDGISWSLQCVLRGRLGALGLWWKHRLAYSSQVYLGKTCWDPRLHFRSTWTSPMPCLVCISAQVMGSIKY